MEHFIIYKTTNVLNNKIYIGQHFTHNIDDDYIGSGLLLSKSIKKYGKSNFIKEIIEECESYDDMNEKEIYWINHYNSIVPNGYNIREGGKNSPMSNITKSILSEQRKGKYQMGENNPNYGGKSFTKETVDKIRNSVKERYEKDPTYRLRVGESSKHRQFSDESRKRMSNNTKGDKNPRYIDFNDDDKKAIINSHVNGKLSMNQLGKVYKVSPQTIKRLLIDNNINISKHINQHF